MTVATLGNFVQFIQTSHCVIQQELPEANHRARRSAQRKT